MVQLNDESTEGNLFDLLWGFEWSQAAQYSDSIDSITIAQFMSILTHVINSVESTTLEAHLPQFFLIFDPWLLNVVNDDLTLAQWRLLILQLNYMTNALRFHVIKESYIEASSAEDEETMSLLIDKMSSMNIPGTYLLQTIIDNDTPSATLPFLLNKVDYLFTVYENRENYAGTITQELLSYGNPVYLLMFALTGRDLEMYPTEVYKEVMELNDAIGDLNYTFEFFVYLKYYYHLDGNAELETPYEDFNTPRSYIEYLAESDPDYQRILAFLNSPDPGLDFTNAEVFGIALSEKKWDVAKTLIEVDHPYVDNFTSEDLDLVAQSFNTEEDLISLINLITELWLGTYMSYDDVMVLAKYMKYMSIGNRVKFVRETIDNYDYEETLYRTLITNLIEEEETPEDLAQTFNQILGTLPYDDPRIGHFFDIYDKIYIESEGSLVSLEDLIFKDIYSDLFEMYVKTGRQLNTPLNYLYIRYIEEVYNKFFDDAFISDVENVVNWAYTFYSLLGVKLTDPFPEPYEGFNTPYEYFLDTFKDDDDSIATLTDEMNAQSS